MNNVVYQYPETIVSPPPHAERVERSVLGSMLVSRIAFDEACNSLQPQQFYITQCRDVFSACKRLHDEGAVADIVLINERLPGHEVFLSELIEGDVATSENVTAHIEHLKQKFWERALLEAAHAVKTAVETGDIERINFAQKCFVETKRDDFKENIFVPSWNNRPKTIKPLLTLSGDRICSPGNMSVLISQPGGGKSAICEAIAAKGLCATADGLGFETDCNSLYIDSERSTADHWESWLRLTRRAHIHENSEVVILFESWKRISKPEARRARLFREIEKKRASLFILDGLGDFVLNTNDLLECNDFLNTLLALIDTHNVGVFATIHHNPQPGNTKARGHLGSEAMRRAESVLIIKRNEDDSRTTTMDFAHGKNRSAPDRIQSSFQWDSDSMMFLSCETPDSKTRISTGQKYEDIARKLIDIKSEWVFVDLVQKLAIISGKTGNDDAGKYLYKKLKTAGFLHKRTDDLWEVSVF